MVLPDIDAQALRKLLQFDSCELGWHVKLGSVLAGLRQYLIPTRHLRSCQDRALFGFMFDGPGDVGDSYLD